MPQAAEPYQLWYDCLQLSDRKRWTKRVRQHFADLDGLAWEQWWEQCRLPLFNRTGPDDIAMLTVETIASPAEFDWYWNQFRTDEHDSICLYAYLGSSKRDLLAAFGKLLDQHHKGRRGRPKVEGGTLAEFDLAGPVNVQPMKKALQVWRARLADESATLWQIGKACEVNANQVPKRGDTAEEVSDKKRVLAVTVSRYLKRADQLIRGVERGVFPA